MILLNRIIVCDFYLTQARDLNGRHLICTTDTGFSLADNYFEWAGQRAFSTNALAVGAPVTFVDTAYHDNVSNEKQSVMLAYFNA